MIWDDALGVVFREGAGIGMERGHSRRIEVHKCPGGAPLAPGCAQRLPVSRARHPQVPPRTLTRSSAWIDPPFLVMNKLLTFREVAGMSALSRDDYSREC